MVIGGKGTDVGAPLNAINLAVNDCDNARGLGAIGLFFTASPNLLDGVDYNEQIRLSSIYIAQAAGIGLGLEYVTDCPDVMARPKSCSDQMFTDQDLPCGLDTAAACQCGGGDTQNSTQRLNSVF